jgi:Type II secretion system (T2SS), protein E, N-terminal domain
VKAAATMAPARRSLWGSGVHWENWSRRCANDSCDTSALRSVFQGKGILIFDEWVCGPDCLESALRERFAELSSAVRPAEAPRPARVPLGLMLFSRGYLNEEQFRTALEAHRHSGARVGDIALQFGYVNEEQVAAALAGQWGYPVFSFKNAPAQLPSLVPVHLMEQHQMIPVQFLDGTRKLLIGFVSRVEFAVLQGIEKMLECVASPCFVTAGDFRSRMRSFSAMGRDSDLVFDQPSHSWEMAHIVRTYAMQAEAETVRFALCRDHLWVRLTGQLQRLELLFKLEVRQSSPA